ncbi:hypothetical protein QBC37DRAFT_398837 [Rhypophila decipiens]|uniref:Uncharacterized protein n=1 Tax=Rhypophila decipiens TaxID=261697 RepID=A0AAN6Y9P1_9PEZI|nr:hypothetical protein QBC37DRAFT_398837 [Rhypophila decipiens]
MYGMGSDSLYLIRFKVKISPTKNTLLTHHGEASRFKSQRGRLRNRVAWSGRLRGPATRMSKKTRNSDREDSNGGKVSSSCTLRSIRTRRLVPEENVIRFWPADLETTGTARRQGTLPAASLSVRPTFVIGVQAVGFFSHTQVSLSSPGFAACATCLVPTCCTLKLPHQATTKTSYSSAWCFMFRVCEKTAIVPSPRVWVIRLA